MIVPSNRFDEIRVQERSERRSRKDSLHSFQHNETKGQKVDSDAFLRMAWRLQGEGTRCAGGPRPSQRVHGGVEQEHG